MTEGGTQITPHGPSSTFELEHRIILWLTDHPASTSHEIAAGVMSRASTVAEILQKPPFNKTVAGKRILYRNASHVREQTGTARRETDCEFLHRVLSDGRPHNLNEILQRSFAERGCGLTVHSRAANLRKRGLNIVNWKDGQRGAGSWYRLESSIEASVADGISIPRRGTDASIEPSARDTAPTSPAVPEGSPQLALTGAAFRRKEAA